MVYTFTYLYSAPAFAGHTILNLIMFVYTVGLWSIFESVFDWYLCANKISNA